MKNQTKLKKQNKQKTKQTKQTNNNNKKQIAISVLELQSLSIFFPLNDMNLVPDSR